jgi:hypothetical protein
MLPFVVLAVRQWGWPPTDVNGDYAQYILHAKALLDGRPYGDVGYLFHPAAGPIGPPAYPPGLPLTLLPILAVAGVSYPLFRVLMLVSMVVFAYAAWRRLSADVEPWQAAIGAGFTALAIEAQPGILGPISDPGFCALLWMAVLVTDAAPLTWRRVVLVIALGFGAIAYRLAGVALVPAFVLYGIVQWRRNHWRGLVPPAVWSAAGLAAALVVRRPLPSMDWLRMLPPDLSARWHMLSTQYRFTLFEAELYPFASNALNDAYHALASLLLVAGLTVILWRIRRSLLGAFLVAYVLMLLAVPTAEGRYLWPIFPLFCTAIPVGAHWCLTRMRVPAVRLRVPLATAFGVILAATLFTALGRERPRSLTDDADTRALFAWAREENTRHPMRVAFRNPRVFTLETGVPAMGLVHRSGPGQFAAWDDRAITHFIWQRDTASCVQRMANALVTSRAERFVLMYDNASYRVYRVLPGPRPAETAWERLDWRARKRLC